VIKAKVGEWIVTIRDGVISTGMLSLDELLNFALENESDGAMYFPDAEIRAIEVLRRHYTVTVIEHVPMVNPPGLLY
jgi:hypothetical protein